MSDIYIEKPLRRVAFSADTIERDRSVIFSKAIGKNKKVSETKILRLLKQKQLDGLESYLKNCNPIELNNIFSSEKIEVLMSYLLSAATNEKLSFILTNIPINCLKNAVRRNNYASLVRFLQGQKIVEQYKADSENIRKVRADKFKFLLAVDEEVTTFMAMAESRAEEYITEKIMQDFKIALNVYNFQQIRARS